VIGERSSSVDAAHEGDEGISVCGALALKNRPRGQKNPEGSPQSTLAWPRQSLILSPENRPGSRLSIEVIRLAGVSMSRSGGRTDFGDVGSVYSKGSGDAGPIGRGPFDSGEHSPRTTTADPGNGADMSGLRCREGRGVHDCTRAGVKDAIGVGSGVCVDTDDVVHGFGDDGHLGSFVSRLNGSSGPWESLRATSVMGHTPLAEWTSF
jgi:hypothetical protein